MSNPTLVTTYGVTLEAATNAEVAALNMALIFNDAVPPSNSGRRFARDFELIDDAGRPLARAELLEALALEVALRMAEIRSRP